MSDTPNLDYFFEGPETLRGADRVARDLFHDIQRHHGFFQAKRIFTEIAKGLTASDEARMNRRTILQRYDAMIPRPSVTQLANELVEEGKRLPLEQQITPRGSTSYETIKRHIQVLLAERKQAMTQGTWDGPPWVWGQLDEGGEDSK
jgi:hypothetical protein